MPREGGGMLTGGALGAYCSGAGVCGALGGADTRNRTVVFIGGADTPDDAVAFVEAQQVVPALDALVKLAL